MSAHREKKEELIKIRFSFAFIVERHASYSIIPEKRLKKICSKISPMKVIQLTISLNKNVV